MLTVLPDVIPTVKCDCDPHLTNRQSIGHIPDNDPQSSEVPADDTVKIEKPDDELPAVKYMREIGYLSPPKYPWPRSPKKRKTTKKKNQQPKKRKTDTPAITNMTASKEIPPAVNEQGEQSEVQVFEEFNPDEILANLYNPPPHHHVALVGMYPCPMDVSRQLTVVIGTSTTGVRPPGGQPTVMSRVEPTNYPNTCNACKLKLTRATVTLPQNVSCVAVTSPWY